MEYTQRSRIELPVYCTVNEGLPHIPKFRSSVLVNGTTYNSPNTFSLRKAAEQDAAKIAMADIEQKINEAVTRCLIYEVRLLWLKNVLDFHGTYSYKLFTYACGFLFGMAIYVEIVA